MIDLDNVSILNILPPNLAEDENVRVAASAFDEVLRSIIEKVPSVSIYPRINEIIDSALLDLLAWQFHVDFYDADMPVDLKRVLVRRSLEWHLRKGTPSAVEEVVAAVFSDAVVTEWYEYGGEPGFFRVETETPLQSDKQYEDILNAIFSVKNTRSWLEFIIVLTNATQTHYIGIGIWLDDTITIGLPSPYNEEEIKIDPPAKIYVGVAAFFKTVDISES